MTGPRMGRRDNDEEPTLAQAWTMIGGQLGMAVEERGERSIRANGVVHGRAVIVDIEGEQASSGFFRFLFGTNTVSSRNRREAWHTVVAVACTNPRAVTGVVESAVDVRDPAWNPREYNPRNGRHVRSDPPTLAQQMLTATTYEALMSITDDVRIDVLSDAVRIDHHATAIPGSGANYVAGSFLHHFQGTPPPWPQRAIIGPPWWIGLLCELANALER